MQPIQKNGYMFSYTLKLYKGNKVSPSGFPKGETYFCLFLLFTEIEQKNFISLL